MAQVLAIQSALTTYKTTLTQFNALKPSAVEIATLNDQINELLSARHSDTVGCHQQPGFGYFDAAIRKAEGPAGRPLRSGARVFPHAYRAPVLRHLRWLVRSLRWPGGPSAQQHRYAERGAGERCGESRSGGNY